MSNKKHVILSETATASLSTSSLGKVPIYNIDTNDFDLVSQFTSKYLISGGASWSGTGLVYDVTTLEYYFNVNKITAPTQVTLDASDPVNNRLDAIVVDESGVISVITGTAASSPITPPIPENQLLVQYILVEAGSVSPSVTQENIYLDDPAGSWTLSTYTTGAPTGTLVFNGTTSPKEGINHIQADADQRLGARFVRATSFDPYQYTMLSMWVRFTGSNVATNKSLNVRFENGAGTLVANTINLFNFGLQRNLLNVWQLVVIPITSFGTLPTSIKGLKIIMTGGTVGQARQWDIDLISLTDNSVPSINEQVFNILKDGALVGQSSSLNFKGAPITVTNDPINKKIDVEVTGGAFTKTKAEIDALIAGDDLVAGALYEITGVHPTLYDDGTTSGTTVYLRAISGSELEVQGMGKFYNPKYNQSVDGFGIWDNKMYGTFSGIVGTFDYQGKEAVTANNAATGLMLAQGMIQFVSGDWSTATSITGDVSGATADVAGFVSPSYGVGDKVIWGGYSWTNVNGNIGASVDVLNLNAEWTKNVYDTTNYNIAYDVIEYDYTNDMIIRRFEKESNVDVKCSKSQYDFFVDNYGFTYHAISVQQFGNEFKISTYKGQLNILVENGYNESINFSGAYQENLTFGIGAHQYNLTFGIGAHQYNLTFGSNAYQENLTFGSNAYQENLTFGSGAVQGYLTFGIGAHQYNLTFGSNAYQNDLTFGSNAYQNDLTFGSGSYQDSLTFGSGASQGYLTFGIGAYQSNLTFGSDASQSNLTFGIGAYQGNLTFGTNASQSNLTFGIGAYQSNLTFGSGAYQENLTFDSSAYQENLTFGSNAYQQNLNFGSNAYQNNLTFGSNARQVNLTFGSNARQVNLTFGTNAYQAYLNFAEKTQLNFNNQTINSNIVYVSFRTKTKVVPDLSAATYIYDGNIKEVYQRSDNTLKIRYHDNSDALQIVDIDD